MRINGTTEQRFWGRVDPCRTDGCWTWTAALINGYGALVVAGRRVYAHHFLKGKPPEGLETDHLCRNRSCVNPAHLEFVTHAVNMQRAHVPGSYPLKTHCKYGHQFTPENTKMITLRGMKVRACVICRQRRILSDTKKRALRKQLAMA